MKPPCYMRLRTAVLCHAAALNTFSAGYVHSAACSFGQYPVTTFMCVVYTRDNSYYVPYSYYVHVRSMVVRSGTLL